MPNIRWVSPLTGRTVRLHFNSKIARLGGQFNCMTLTKSDIFIAQDWITARTLAHEDGHTLQAERLGWRYLPWVLFHYAKSGYAKSLPERDADEHMEKHAHRYAAVGRVPSWVRDA
jgi:hypothetical protein